MIYCDLDGVLRDLCKTANIEPTEWDCKIEGLEFTDYFSEHLHLLKLAVPTEYLDMIKVYREYVSSICILTDQPRKWQPYAIQWLETHFDLMPDIIFTETKDKLKYLSDNDILIEDYPKLKDYSKVWLIDRTYNRDIRVPIRIHTPRQLFFKLSEVK